MRSVAQMKALIGYVVRRFDGNLDETVPEDLVERVVNYITDHMEEQIMRDDIAHYIHLNPDYLTRIFKRETGMTLKEFIIKTKMKEAQMLIESTRLPISLIAAKVGYTNFSHFSYSYKKIMGITPQEKRRGEAEEA
jgi:two-component system response regulator YesN